MSMNSYHLTTSATSPQVFASVCLSVCACCRSQCSERASLAGAEAAPIVPDTFLLQSTVKPFYVSVIVRPAEAAVAQLYASSF